MNLGQLATIIADLSESGVDPETDIRIVVADDGIETFELDNVVAENDSITFFTD